MEKSFDGYVISGGVSRNSVKFSLTEEEYWLAVNGTEEENEEIILDKRIIDLETKLARCRVEELNATEERRDPRISEIKTKLEQCKSSIAEL